MKKVKREELDGKNSLKWKYLFYVLMIIYILFIVFYVAKLPHRAARFDSEFCYRVEEGWEYIHPDGTLEYLETPFVVEPNVGDKLQISYRMPMNTEEKVNTLATWTGMRFVDVFLDGEQIYEHENANPYGKVEGTGWLIVRLPNDWQGKKLTLEISSPYKEYVVEFQTFLIGTKASILFELIRMCWGNLLVSVVLILMGIILIALYLFINKLLNQERGIAYLGWFQLVIGIWLFTESFMTQFFTGNALIIDSLTYVAMTMIPVPLLLYLLENVKSKGKIAIHIMIGMHTFAAVLILALQTWGIRAMYEMVPLLHGLIAISAIVIIIFTMIDTIVYKGKTLRFVGYSTIILTIGGTLELLFYYSGTRLFVGVFLQIATILCMILITSVVVKKALSVVRISSEAVYYEKLALLDFMTQCQNRTSYQRELEREEKRIFERGNITVILADLNNLKQMNDDLGHHIGDAAIKLCGKLILQTFRDYGKCFRVGGDEFACILYHCQEDEVQELIAEFKEACEAENKEWDYNFGVAIGYAMFDKKQDQNLEDAVRRADKKMYEDKRASKAIIR